VKALGQCGECGGSIYPASYQGRLGCQCHRVKFKEVPRETPDNRPNEYYNSGAWHPSLESERHRQ